jgi:hypothetical protein
MYFGTKSYLKSNHNHTAKHAQNLKGSREVEIYPFNFFKKKTKIYTNLV